MRSVRPRTIDPKRVHFALRKTARRLVEEQELRFRHESASQGGALLYGVRERGGHPARVVGPRRSSSRIAIARRCDGALLPAGAPDAQERGPQVGVQRRFRAEHHVLVHGQPGTEADALQGAGRCRALPGQ